MNTTTYHPPLYGTPRSSGEDEAMLLTQLAITYLDGTSNFLAIRCQVSGRCGRSAPCGPPRRDGNVYGPHLA